MMDARHWAAVIGLLVAFGIGIHVGLGIERMRSLQTEATPPKKVLDKNAAWNGIYGCPRPPKEDLRTLAPLASWRFNAARD